MNRLLPRRSHILFLFSDTGGGHRSAAEALIEALHLEFGETISTEMVDIFKDYAPRPLNHMPDLYPKMVLLPKAWGIGYHLSDGYRRARLINASTWPYIRRSIRSLVAQHPSDLIVSVHPLATAPVLRALGPQRPPFITMVTDMVTVHALWYNRHTDLCIVATEEARRRALLSGLRPDQVEVVGLPVADRFCQPLGDRDALRQDLGWPKKRPVVLLVGGGEGMGPLEKTAHAIETGCPGASLAVIAGRNQNLKEHLEAHRWKIPTFIYGFVHNMPDLMRAADVLVTKAGPGTISEALIAGLPMILYSRLPGQEDGNVSYIVTKGAGFWAPHPDQIVQKINLLISQPSVRERAIAACHRLARPQAARQIAHILAEWVGVKVEQ